MSSRSIEITETTTGIRLSVRAKPRSTKSRVVGVREGALEVALAAPPVDGAANDELVRTLAKTFEVPKTSVRVVIGLTGKNKVVEIDALGAERARQLLEPLL